MVIFKGRVIPTSDTKPEMIVRSMLEELKIPFKSQQKVLTRFRDYPFIVDFLLENGKVIEVMGRRWHDHSERQRRKVQTKVECLTADGHPTLIIWDDQLRRKSDLPLVKEKIKEFVFG
jgi:G:T-mismatch repair DNA endonuclease (very short patch repair protein)